VPAVIIETIRGEGGFIVPADGFLPALRNGCRKNKWCSSPNEVQTGFARTGAMFAASTKAIDTDLICTDKGHRRRPAAVGGHRQRQIMEPARQRAGGTTAASPSRARRRWPPCKPSKGRRLVERRAPDRTS